MPSAPMVKILIPVLQVLLDIFTEPLVHGLLNVIVDQCSNDAQRLLCSGPVTDENNSVQCQLQQLQQLQLQQLTRGDSFQKPCWLQRRRPTQHTGDHLPLQLFPTCTHPCRAGPAPEDLWQDVGAVAGPSAPGRSHRTSAPGCNRGCLPAYQEALVSHKRTLGPKLYPALQNAVPPSALAMVPATIQSNKRKQMSLSLAQSLCTAFSPFSWWLSLTPHPTTDQEAQGCTKRCVSHDDGRVTGKNTGLMLSGKS